MAKSIQKWKNTVYECKKKKMRKTKSMQKWKSTVYECKKVCEVYKCRKVYEFKKACKYKKVYGCKEV